MFRDVPEKFQRFFRECPDISRDCSEIVQRVFKDSSETCQNMFRNFQRFVRHFSNISQIFQRFSEISEIFCSDTWIFWYVSHIYLVRRSWLPHTFHRFFKCLGSVLGMLQGFFQTQITDLHLIQRSSRKYSRDSHMIESENLQWFSSGKNTMVFDHDKLTRYSSKTHKLSITNQCFCTDHCIAVPEITNAVSETFWRFAIYESTNSPTGAIIQGRQVFWFIFGI